MNNTNQIQNLIQKEIRKQVRKMVTGITATTTSNDKKTFGGRKPWSATNTKFSTVSREMADLLCYEKKNGNYVFSFKNGANTVELPDAKGVMRVWHAGSKTGYPVETVSKLPEMEEGQRAFDLPVKHIDGVFASVKFYVENSEEKQ